MLKARRTSELAIYNQAISSYGLIDYEDEIYGEQGLISDTKISASEVTIKQLFMLVHLTEMRLVLSRIQVSIDFH